MRLVPMRLDRLLTRMFQEYQREGKIFDLPKSRFFHGDPALDTSITFQGSRAATPLGPAAGPHGQMAQNIVLAWLGGARAIELKTIQVLDQLDIPRPCIHVANVGYNVEWSQELELKESLREYVKAAMALHILKSTLADEFPLTKQDTLLDMSVGYSLEGLRSAPVRQWIAAMKDARTVIDELRGCLTGKLAHYRYLDFPASISNSVALSTFHGCPADEIERICEFLLCEMDLDVCIKMNPTLLRRQVVEHLLYDVLGYTEIRLVPEAFEKDLKFDEALGIVRRLDDLARSRGRRLAVKFSNTLVVANHGKFFRDAVMYLSGQPLHVIALHLVQKFREQIGRAIPISFSAGVDAHNFAAMVALNLAPVTTCTDLLRPGGYARLPRYMENLEAKMCELGAATRAEFVLRHGGAGKHAIADVLTGAEHLWKTQPLATEQRTALDKWISSAHSRLEHWWYVGAGPGRDASLTQVAGAIARDFDRSVRARLPQALADQVGAHATQIENLLVERAGVLNTAPSADQAAADPRYSAERNRAVPRKIHSQLYLYDCIQCDKCVPVCPNDANFVYETEPRALAYSNYVIHDGRLVETAGGVFKVARAQQIANYADFCNDCGNCDVHCPEDGGPNAAKPRFFGSLETYREAGQQGFYVEYSSHGRVIYGTLQGAAYRLAVEDSYSSFDDGVVEVEFRGDEVQVSNWCAKPQSEAEGHTVRLLPYLQLRCLLDAVSDARRINYVNLSNR